MPVTPEQEIIAKLDALETRVCALQDRTSFKKNGHTWGQWVNKYITPQNVLMGLGIAFMAYGEWRDMKSDVRGVMATAAQITQDFRAAMQKTDTMAETVLALQMEIRQQREAFATKSDLDLVREALRMNVSRREFRDAMDEQRAWMRRIEATVAK